MTALQGSPRFTGFIRRLVEDGLVSTENMHIAVTNAKKTNQDIVPYLIENSKLNPLVIAEKISEEFGEPVFDLSVYDSVQILRDLVEDKLITKHRVCRYTVVAIFSISLPAIQPTWMRWTRFASILK